MIRKVLGTFAVLALFSASLHAAPVTINFDDLTDGDIVGSSYASQGVTFVDAVINTNNTLLGGSGTNAIRHVSSVYQPLPADPIEAIFSTAVSSVSLTGLDVGGAGFVLSAYDSSNTLVATDSEFGTGAGVGEFFTLTLTGLDIVRVTFSQVYATYDDGIVFDDLTYVTVAAVPLPAAAWLFASALVGFVGFGTRKKV